MFRKLATLSAALVAISCSEPTEAGGEGLSGAELSALVGLVASNGLFPSPLPQTTPWPCPQGGTAGRTLAFSSPTSGSVVREGTVTFTSCGEVIEGRQYTVSGSVTVEDRFVVEAGDIVQAEGTYDGTVSWEVGDRSGSCSLSLTVSALAGSLTLTGIMCGDPVEHTV